MMPPDGSKFLVSYSVIKQKRNYFSKRSIQRIHRVFDAFVGVMFKKYDAKHVDGYEEEDEDEDLSTFWLSQIVPRVSSLSTVVTDQK